MEQTETPLDGTEIKVNNLSLVIKNFVNTKGILKRHEY